MNKFQPLEVISIRNLTSDSVEISFDISNNDLFRFVPGQYITIRHNIEDQEIRRSYSICSTNNEGLSIGVKRIKGGRMSTFLTTHIQQGDMLDVMPPMGNFIIQQEFKYHVAICAGSGITPIISMIKTILSVDNTDRFILIYGNKKQESTMFLKELEELEYNNSNRFKIYWAYSQDNISGSIKGRLDKRNIQILIQKIDNINLVDSFFLCGPGDFIDNANELLLENNIIKNKIRFERFYGIKDQTNLEDDSLKETISDVTVTIDGDDFEFQLSSKDATILDAALDHGADLPFSCKGAVCCTCKGKVLKGEVMMTQNYSLSEEEVAQGYILGCQSHPISKEVIIDFDEV